MTLKSKQYLPSKACKYHPRSEPNGYKTKTGDDKGGKNSTHPHKSPTNNTTGTSREKPLLQNATTMLDQADQHYQNSLKATENATSSPQNATEPQHTPKMRQTHRLELTPKNEKSSTPLPELQTFHLRKLGSRTSPPKIEKNSTQLVSIG